MFLTLLLVPFRVSRYIKSAGPRLFRREPGGMIIWKPSSEGLPSGCGI
jgi:hypothetical protein